MGSRGPVPKRTDQRRRTNTDPAGPVTKVPAAAGAASPRGKRAAVMPSANREWHSIARRWYMSLARSGQREFYQPSDWMQAYVAAEILSRLLSAEKLSAVGIAAWDAMAARLLVTEGDRRRMRIELEQPGKPDDPDAIAGVTSMAAWQSNLAAGAP